MAIVGVDGGGYGIAVRGEGERALEALSDVFFVCLSGMVGWSRL